MKTRVIVLFLMLFGTTYAYSLNLLDYIEANPNCLVNNNYTACFQDAVDSIKYIASTSNNQFQPILYVPAGYYTITQPINMQDVSIHGDGESETVLRFLLASPGSCLKFTKRFNKRQVKNFSIQTGTSNEEITLLDFHEGIFNSTVENVELTGPNAGNTDPCVRRAIGVRVNTTKGGAITRESDNNLFSKLTFRARFQYGFYVHGDTIAPTPTDPLGLPYVFNANVFVKCRFAASDIQVRLQRAENNSFQSCTWAGNKACGGAHVKCIVQKGGNSTLIENCYFDGANEDGFITTYSDAVTWTPVYTIGLLNDCSKIKVIGNGAPAVCFLDRRTAVLEFNKLRLSGVQGTIRLQEPGVQLNYINIDSAEVKIFANQEQLHIKNRENTFVAGAQKMIFAYNDTIQTISSTTNILFNTSMFNFGGYTINNDIIKTGSWGRSIYEVDVSVNYNSENTIDSTDSRLRCRLVRLSAALKPIPISKWFYGNDVSYKAAPNVQSGTIEFRTMVMINKLEEIICRCEIIGVSSNFVIYPMEAQIIIKRIANSDAFVDY